MRGGAKKGKGGRTCSTGSLTKTGSARQAPRVAIQSMNACHVNFDPANSSRMGGKRCGRAI
jgi:hypothetical protein